MKYTVDGARVLFHAHLDRKADQAEPCSDECACIIFGQAMLKTNA